MVALDNCGIARPRLNDVRIDRSLRQIFDMTDLLSLGFKDPDELLADNLSLFFGNGNSIKLRHKSVLGVDSDEINFPVGECFLDLVALVLSHKAVVNENTGKLASNSLGKKRRTNG